ncbi:hypothetical protein D3C75_617290 [compost metagenome]
MQGFRLHIGASLIKPGQAHGIGVPGHNLRHHCEGVPDAAFLNCRDGFRIVDSEGIGHGIAAARRIAIQLCPADDGIDRNPGFVFAVRFRPSVHLEPVGQVGLAVLLFVLAVGMALQLNEALAFTQPGKLLPVHKRSSA